MFGAGSVGLSAVLGAVVSGARTIIAVDVVPDRLALATELGATHVVDGREPDMVERIREITAGGADYAVEASGNGYVVATALSSVADGGTVAIVGIADLAATLSISHYELVMGRTLVGVTEGSSNPQVFIPDLIELWRAGRFPVERLITSYDFGSLNDAVRDSASGVTVKPVLTF